MTLTRAQEFEQIYVPKKRWQEVYAAEIYLTGIMRILGVDSMEQAYRKVQIQNGGFGPTGVRHDAAFTG